MIDYESQTTFWFMAYLIFYGPPILPHPPHSIDHLLTVPHLHFNRGGSQTSIPSSFMSLDSLSILPHGPSQQEKAGKGESPPAFATFATSVCMPSWDRFPWRVGSNTSAVTFYTMKEKEFISISPRDALNSILQMPHHHPPLLTPLLIPIHFGWLGNCSRLALRFFWSLNTM